MSRVVSALHRLFASQLYATRPNRKKRELVQLPQIHTAHVGRSSSTGTALVAFVRFSVTTDESVSSVRTSVSTQQNTRDTLACPLHTHSQTKRESGPTPSVAVSGTQLECPDNTGALSLIGSDPPRSHSLPLNSHLPPRPWSHALKPHAHRRRDCQTPGVRCPHPWTRTHSPRNMV